MPGAQGVSHQGQRALHPLCTVPHHQGTAKVDTPKFTLFSPRSPSWDKTLWRNPGRSPHMSAVWSPFPRQG